MDAKITLSFDREVIRKAKKFAASKNISLSRLTEMLYEKITQGGYQSLEDFPIADWVNELAEGEAIYRTRPRARKTTRKEYLASRR